MNNEQGQEVKSEATEQAKTFSEVRAKYYEGTRRLQELRDDESALYSQIRTAKAELFEAVGRGLCQVLKDGGGDPAAVLHDDDGTALQDRTGMVGVPIELLSEALRFLKHYRDGKPAPQKWDDIPY